MSGTRWGRKAPTIGLALLMALTILVSLVGAAFAEGAPYQEVPGYPKYGCYDVAVAGTGMWSGNSPYPVALQVPGPVVDAYLVWIGTEDVGAPDSPNKSDLTVNGQTVVGNLVDQVQFGNAGSPWYMWRADIGPNGYKLVQQGLNKYDLSGWGFVQQDTRRNGVSIVAVYSTGACARGNKVDVFDTMDWYWERQTGVTDVLPLTFPPAPVDRDITVWLHHAGTDHTTPCREENIWALVGTGTPPTSLVNYYTTPPSPANGGKLVVENPFVQASCAQPAEAPAAFTTWKFPVTSLLGWVDGSGPTPNVGGFIAPEWSIVRITVRVPAGANFVALQLESEKTGVEPVTHTGESGAWFAQSVIALYNPELKITKTDGVDQAKPGDTLTYTINYENYGVSAAENVVIQDKLPDWASYAAASNGGVYDAATDTVTWNVGALAIGQKGSVTLSVKLDGVFPPGSTTLTNTATISTTTVGEMDPSDNTAVDTTAVTAKAQLSIDKTAAPEPVEAGANLTYGVKWTVGGNAFSEDVRITDALPVNVSFVSANGGGLYDPATRTVTWLLGDVTPVKNGEYQVVVKVKSPLYNGTKIDNTAVIRNKAGDTAQDTVTTTVTANHMLMLSKTDAPDPVKKGANLTYTINWSVTGNEPADDVVLEDVLPAGVTFVSATNGGAYDAATRSVTWDIGDKLPGDSGSVTLVVKVDADFQGLEIVNTATISDFRPGTEEEATATTEVLQPKLTLTKKATPAGNVEPGALITYEVCYESTGNVGVTGVVITDPIPANTTYVAGSASDNGSYTAATKQLTWNLGSLALDAKDCVTFKVTVNDLMSGSSANPSKAMSFAEWNVQAINNTATLTSNELPPLTATVSNPLVALKIYKSISRPVLHAGEELVFTLTVENNGSAATNVLVTDQISTKLEKVTATSTKGTVSFNEATRWLAVNIGSMAPDEIVKITIRGFAVRVPAAQLPYNIVNVGQVAFNEGTPRLSNEVVAQVVYFATGEIPEPGTWLLLGSGLAGLAGYTRVRVQARRRKKN